jgi:hypothetical protein
MILKLIIAIAQFITRRGTGLFKALFVIDDFIRVFTMTILFIILSSWLRFPTIIMFLLAMLGLVIDIQDFIEDNEFAKFFDG